METCLSEHYFERRVTLIPSAAGRQETANTKRKTRTARRRPIRAVREEEFQFGLPPASERQKIPTPHVFSEPGRTSIR